VKAVGRFVSDTTGSLPAPYSSPIVFEHLLPMSPVTPPNYEGDNAKIVSSAGPNNIQILGDNVPTIHIVHIRKLSSQIPVHTGTTRILLDTNHTSSMKTSSALRHAAPVKLNTVDVAVRPPMNDVNTLLPDKWHPHKGII
jgi:hypothetical protein